jgi:hypothetical protein
MRGRPSRRWGNSWPAGAGSVGDVNRFFNPPRGGEAFNHSRHLARRVMQIGSNGHRQCNVNPNWLAHLVGIVPTWIAACAQDLTRQVLFGWGCQAIWSQERKTFDCR